MAVTLAVASGSCAIAKELPPVPSISSEKSAEGTQNKIERSIEEISATLKKGQEPSQHDKPCPAGDNRRSSDLCAQWKAADAADSAARAAWWIGFAGTLVGALTLAAAWSAAKWARKAAEHTQTGSEQARRAADAAEKSLAQAEKTSHADLRAWVSLDLTLKEVRRTDNFVMVSVSTALKNIGKTPALRVTVSLAVRIIPSVVTNNGDLPALDGRQNQLSSLLPGISIEFAEGKRINMSDIEGALADCRSAGFPPIIVVDAVAFYHTVFDAEEAPKRLTSIRYFLVGKISASATDRSGQWSWLERPNPFGYLDPDFVHDKSAPTYLT